MNIEQHTIEEWLSGEKIYKKEIVRTLLQNHSEEEVAKIILTSNGVENTSSFGGNATQLPNETYWNRFKKEFDMFICGHPKYQKFIDEIKKNGNIIKITTTSFIASALAPSVGFAASFLTVPVVLMLQALSKISINAYCHNIHFE
jgi:hypothetical protein